MGYTDAKPASKQGLVGLKPTFGLVPYTGIVGLEPSLDHTGPMTRDVALNAALLQAIAGYDGIDDRALPGCPSTKTVPDYVAATKAGAHGIRVGILREGFDQPTCDPRVDDLVRKAVHSFNALGMQVEEVSVPMHRAAPSLWAVCTRLRERQMKLMYPGDWQTQWRPDLPWTKWRSSRAGVERLY